MLMTRVCLFLRWMMTFLLYQSPIALSLPIPPLIISQPLVSLLVHRYVLPSPLHSSSSLLFTSSPISISSYVHIPIYIPSYYMYWSLRFVVYVVRTIHVCLLLRSRAHSSFAVAQEKPRRSKVAGPETKPGRAESIPSPSSVTTPRCHANIGGRGRGERGSFVPTKR